MNTLSVHYIPAHGRPGDIDYFTDLRPKVVKFVDGDPHRVRQVYERLPNSLYFLRNWALSEQHEDAYRDPVGTAQRHAATLNKEVRNLGIPVNQIIVPGINEPHVWSALEASVRYYAAFVDACSMFGLRAAALNLSVGWPANNGTDTPPDWKPFEPVLQAMKRGAGHVLCLHEYWDHRGPDFNWGWWGGRYEACPWDVPIVIGECGIDMYVSTPGIDPLNRGWRGHVNAEGYTAQMRRYCDRLATDGRILGACLYTTDYNSPWQSFDTQDAHHLLRNVYVESVQHPRPTPPPPDEGHKPTPPPPAPSGSISHPCPGARITQRWNENPQNYIAFNIPGHNGTDFGVNTGTPILSMADGEVAMTGNDGGYGNYVRVYHPQLRLCSFYAHLSSITVKIGDAVTAGQQVGLSGNTGNSTGPHLHFEVRLMTEDGRYSTNSPQGKGRCDPQSICAYLGLKL